MAPNPVSPSKLRRWHSELCFRWAFPRKKSEYSDAITKLACFSSAVDGLSATGQQAMFDSGIAGTPVHYRFSFEVAQWLARNVPNAVSIDWPEIDKTDSLDNLLRHILQPSEDEHFDGGQVSTREWIDKASAGFDGTDFDWLIAQLKENRMQPFYRRLYDAADLPLVWSLGDSSYSKSCNVFSGGSVVCREDEMRGRPRNVKKEIARPVDKVTRLSGKRGAELLDVAIASLAVRHRETNHFSFGNAEEVYVADVGKGISIAVFGLAPEHRYPLECTMGFLILSNNVPIGYGGSSTLFKQVNTGINIFDEYRGSEASYLWVQVMRVFHSLVGCTRFIANAYQFGGENREALKSGAFWFYYHLGYRPVDTAVRQLALKEQAKIRRKPGYRSDLQTLRRLASGDMHLMLPSARQSEFFDEDWLETSSGLATDILGRAKARTRQGAANLVVRELMADLRIRSVASWTTDEKRGLIAMAPFVAALNPSNWPDADKRIVRNLLRAKGGKRELMYASLLADNDRFLQELRAACKKTQLRN